MNSIQAVIFDFDGTLAELTIDFSLMKRKVAALAAGFLPEPPKPDDKPVLEWIDQLADQIAEYEGSEVGQEFHSRGRLVVTATELDAARSGQLFHFSEGLLEHLAGLGVGRGIFTRNSMSAVRIVFPEISKHCEIFLPREDARRVKPDPEHVHQMLETLGTPPEHTLVVGDYGMDIEAGRAAGCLTAGVLSGNMTRSVLRSFKPDFIEKNADLLCRRLESEGLFQARTK
ncbi:MAG: HAD family hydrolase [Desulfovibrionaceae bacterium]